jgi:Ca2+-binding RTX toxin-like protein
MQFEVSPVNDPPTGTVTISGTVRRGQTLTVSNNLADADGMGTVSYQWLANDTAISGATGAGYTLTRVDVGKVISVVASYTDGGGTAEAVTTSVSSAVQADPKSVEITTASRTVDSIGLTPDGRSLVIKIDGMSQTVSRDAVLDFSDRTVTPTDLINSMDPIPVFSSVLDGRTKYVLPDLFTGPASLNLDYQLIDDTPNAVMTGSDKNDFIKLSNTNSIGKAIDAGAGDDVIDGGVGSAFVTGGAGSNTFFLDGRADGVSWSTITDFKLDVDKATIWGWKQGVSKVARIDMDGGAPGYEGVTFHFENLLPSNATDGQTNGSWNSLTFSGKTLADFGASSLEQLNAQITASSNPTFMTGVSEDQFGAHGYLYLS